MKRKLFLLLTDKVCALFYMEKDKLLIKSKEPSKVKARYMLVHLCHDLGMETFEIMRHFHDAGITLHSSTFKRAIEMSRTDVKRDSIYRTEFNKIIQEHVK